VTFHVYEKELVAILNILLDRKLDWYEKKHGMYFTWHKSSDDSSWI